MKLLKRATAVALSLALLLSFTSIAFADDAADETPTTEVSIEEALEGAEQEASKLAGTLFRFLAFLHQMYVFFARLNGIEDPYADFFIDEAGIAHIEAYLQNLF